MQSHLNTNPNFYPTLLLKDIKQKLNTNGDSKTNKIQYKENNRRKLRLVS